MEKVIVSLTFTSVSIHVNHVRASGAFPTGQRILPCPLRTRNKRWSHLEGFLSLIVGCTTPAVVEALAHLHRVRMEVKSHIHAPKDIRALRPSGPAALS